MSKIKRSRNIKEYISGTLFVAPFMILFFTFVAFPVIISLLISLTDYDMLQKPNFVGLENYSELFLNDDVFGISVRNTLLFALISGPIGLFCSFGMACLINKMKCRSLFAIGYYAPSITSGIAMSVVWLYLFSSDRYGLVNNLLIQLGIIDSPILFTQDARYLIYIIILIKVWMSMGNCFLVFLAGLQNINTEYLEAAQIDGIRSSWQELVYIIIPQMKPQLLFGCIDAITGSFAVFDIVVGFAGMPSPNYAAHTIVAHLYDYAFIRFEMGYASAISVVLFAFTFGINRFVMKLLSD